MSDSTRPRVSPRHRFFLLLASSWNLTAGVALSVIAKLAVGANGVVGALRGQRDLVTAISLADGAWVPGFAVAAVAMARPR